MRTQPIEIAGVPAGSKELTMTMNGAATAIFARALAMLGFGASDKRLMRFAPTVPISPRAKIG